MSMLNSPITPDTEPGRIQRLAARGLTELRGILSGAGDNGDLRRSALIAFGVRIIAAALAYLSQIVLVRLVGGYEYGVFAYVFIWVIILSQICSLGFHHAVIRFVSEALVKKAYSELQGAVRVALTVCLVFSTVFAATGAFVLDRFWGVEASPYILPFIIAALCLPLLTLEQCVEGISRGFGWVNLALIPPYLLRPSLMLIFLVVSILSGADATAATAVKCAIGAALVSIVIQSIILFWRMRKTLPATGAHYTPGVWAAVALPMVVVDGSGLLQYHADLIVLSAYVAPDQLAIYFAAAKTISLIAIVHFAVTAVANQRFAGLAAAGDEAGMERFIRQTTHWTFWPALAAALGFVVMGKPLLWLFGEEFEAGYPIMLILACGLLIRAYVGLSEQILNMTGHHRKSAMVLIVGCGLNLVLNVALVPVLGLEGAAIATVISTFIQALFHAAFVKQATGVNPILWHPFGIRVTT
jgi:O-antigen/teichoic acid export membrane protein